MNILVIYGGDSSEREVSLRSGKNVGEALVLAGYSVQYFDPAVGIHQLHKALDNIDVVFPILHGTGGEDGFIQNALEKENVLFVGTGSKASKDCFDKWGTIQLAKKSILFPKSALVNIENIEGSELINNPFVIKPRAEGSSVDTFIVRDPSKFDIKKLDDIFNKYNNELLLEELISGQEITAGVLLEQALPIVEILPPEGEEFDFSNKYNGATKEYCPPKNISKDLQLKAQGIALELHSILKCRHISRTDMIIDKKGDIYTLEINTLPGMTNESLLPRAAAVTGYTMSTLVDMLVKSLI